MQKNFLQKFPRKTIIIALVVAVAVVAAIAFFADPVPSEAAETPAFSLSDLMSEFQKVFVEN